MPKQFRVEIKGLEESLAGLDKIKVVVRRAIEEAIKTGAFKVQRDAQLKIAEMDAVDTGNMRASAITTWQGHRNAPVPKFTAYGIKSQRSPEDMRKLREGFRVSVKEFNGLSERLSNDGFAAVTGFGAYYSVFVHEGHNVMGGKVNKGTNKESKLAVGYVRPRPFLKEAVLQNEKHITQQIKQAVRRALQSFRA